MSEKKKNYTKEIKQLLDSLIKQAKRKGYIQESTIKDKFSRYAPTDPEMENIFSESEAEGINIVFSEDDDLFIENEKECEIEVPQSTPHSSSLTDPLQLHLNEIYKYPSISYKETMVLVKKIQRGDMEKLESIFHPADA